MNMTIIVICIIVITIFSFFGSWYVRKYNKTDTLVGLYVAFVLISNILAYKLASFDFGFNIKRNRKFLILNSFLR
jgi:hypothetical protein